MVSLLKGLSWFEVHLFTVNMLHFLLDMVSTVREILRRGMSVNLYMFHGGSTFGFASGALADPSYKALVPSYGWFLCVMCSITNKLAVSQMQIYKDFFQWRGTAVSELENMFLVVDRTALTLTTSRRQHMTVNPCYIAMFDRLWCSLVWSWGVHSKVPSPSGFTLSLQQ